MHFQQAGLNISSLMLMKTAKTPFYKALPASLDQPVSDTNGYALEGHHLIF
jgi:hypothetical protein